MKKLLLVIFLSAQSYALWAGPTKVGNGDDGADLEGFDLITKGVLVESKNQAVALLNKFNTSGIVGLGNLLPELQNEKIYLTQKDTSSKRLEELGAFHSGMEGLVYARTFARPYAPVRFFPAALKLTSSQLVALHIHEALHRALPERVREDEKVVSKITLAITSPEQTSDSIQATVKEVMPELFVQKNISEIVVNEKSHFSRPNNLDFSYQRWLNTSRDNTSGLTLPMQQSFDLDAQAYPFGGERYAIGFGVGTSYIMTKGNQNYIGPLDLTVRQLMWTDSSYDFEFNIGAQMMSDSNSKIINSLYGHNALIFGLGSSKVKDDYTVNFGMNYVSRGNITRMQNGKSTDNKIGDMVNINAGIMFSLGKFDLGGNGTLHTLSSLKITQGSNVILDKRSDQYISAGPEMKYRLDSIYTLGLKGDYLFNSNKNPNEDYVSDLFGSGLGQWKWSTGVSVVF
jgi:hypothetical protein